MTFSLSGAKLESAGTPGAEDCHDVTLSGLAETVRRRLTQLPPHWDSPVFKPLQNSFRAFLRAVEEHIHARAVSAPVVREDVTVIALSQQQISTSLPLTVLCKLEFASRHMA